MSVPPLPAAAPQRMIPAPPLPPVLPDLVLADLVLPEPVLADSGGIAAGALAGLVRGHEATLLAVAELHEQFIAQQRAAASTLAKRGGRRPSRQALDGPALPGPAFTRAELAELATMRRSVSSLLGPGFAGQDAHRYQLRIPAPPMLFTDRILGIEGAPGSLGGGRLLAELDLTENMFGLGPAGRASVFLIGEAGQANMLLASWLGADLAHDGGSRYRVVNLDLTGAGALPRAGETLRTEVVLERQEVVGGTRMFFFAAFASAAGRPVVSARFTAGLFTEAQLSEPGEVRGNVPHGAGPAGRAGSAPHARSFGREALAALREGRVADCFGESHRRAATHVRTPRLAMPELFLLDSVEAFEPPGGSGGPGYLRATQPVTPDDWYFAAHLPGDPCLPGFLMLEGAMQSLAFYLTAAGATIPRDGWRFEPSPGVTFSCRFRGQVVPQSATLVYEVFVESMPAGPVPEVVADVTCRLDGRVIFHVRRLSLRLVPDWPLEQFRSRPHAGALGGAAGPLPALAGLAGRRPDPEAAIAAGIEMGKASLLAFAWGRAQDALGPRVAVLDGPLRWARIPAPPFLFITRVTRIEAESGAPRPGARVETSWDIPETAWFFTDNGAPVMPFAVMLEALLQPCGWLMAFTGPLEEDGRPFTGHYRNLDGTMTIQHELPRRAARLDVTVELVSMSRLGGIVLFTMRMRGSVGGTLICAAHTTFGMFPAQALSEQAGVPATPGEQARVRSPGDRVIDLAASPARFFSGTLRLPAPRLLMIDRVTAIEPDGGDARLGWARAEKTVDPGEWFFKAHFYQDPVQPGSLGLEMLLQLLQVIMIERGVGSDLPEARFEPVATGRELSWKYRGQVLPESRSVVAEVELTEAGHDDRGPFVIANGWLWVDGTRVYQAAGLGMRIVAGSA